MADDVVRVRATPVSEIKGRGVELQYQSSQAAEVAKMVPRTEEVPQPALVGTPLPTASQVENAENPDDPVLVTPRKSIPRTRIGNNTYSFQENKKCIVPRHVARLLEEKGVV